MHASEQSSHECRCLEGNRYYENFEDWFLGEDAQFGQVTISQCKQGGRLWLDYLMEYEHRTAEGRWFRGLITPEIAAFVTPATAQKVLEGLDWYFLGGSAFGGKVSRIPSGQLKYWLI